jgi:uncharacterized SAM-binding protein YcdF (DUF218 family)
MGSEQAEGLNSTVIAPLDAVVVLGAAVWEGGMPSPSLSRRARHGARLMLSGQARILIASGSIGPFPPSEASVIKKIAIEQGVSEHDILVEERSRNTVENALFCAELMRANNWLSAWIVSDRYHLLRAVALFRYLGIQAAGSPADLHGRGTPRVMWYYLHARELLALPSSLIRMRLLKARLGEE